LSWLPFEMNVGSVLLSLLLLGSVSLDTVQELLSTLGVVDVLDADIYPFLQVTVPDFLIDNNTEGGLGDIVDDTGLSVVDLVRHTILQVSITI